VTERRMGALRAMANSGVPGLATAAQNAIDRHNAKLLEKPDPTALPPGPNLTNNGRPFKAREYNGEIWVAVRGCIAQARAQEYVKDRRRMLVTYCGHRLAMVPTRVDVDDERQQVHVVAPLDSLEEWWPDG
jgi:hypothetical protein